MTQQLRVLPVLPGVHRDRKNLPAWPAFVIGLLILSAVIFPPGVTTGINLYLLLLAGVLSFSSRQAFDRELMRVGLIFSAMLTIGLLSGVGADYYLYLKDAWYVSNPLILVAAGYVIYRCRPDVGFGLRAFLIAGTLVAVIYLIPIAMQPDVLLRSAVEVRELAGTGYYAPVLGVTILVAYRGRWREDLRLAPWICVLCGVVCLTAMVLSFSRMTLMAALIGLLAAFGVFKRSAWLRLGVVAVAMLLALGVLRASIDTTSAEAGRSFLGKLARSMDEIAVEEYTDVRRINDRWRGYETARALHAYKAGSEAQLLFGQGFGAEVDLGLYMNLSGKQGEAVRYIPIFHNGYVYLLVKIGAVGVMLFLLSLWLLYRVAARGTAGRGEAAATVPAARIMQAAVISVAVATWFIGGAFNKFDLFAYLLVIGFLLAAVLPIESTSTAK